MDQVCAARELAHAEAALGLQFDVVKLPEAKRGLAIRPPLQC